MGGAKQDAAYRTAFEHAVSRLEQLTLEVAALDHRQTALLNATKVLEGMIAQRADASASARNSSAVASRPVPSRQPDTELTSPLIHTYVHEADAPNEIQRRIDLAIGR